MQRGTKTRKSHLRKRRRNRVPRFCYCTAIPAFTRHAQLKTSSKATSYCSKFEGRSQRTIIPLK